jgi:hypothetical protein
MEVCHDAKKKGLVYCQTSLSPELGYKGLYCEVEVEEIEVT